MVGAILSWGFAWPLVRNRAGDWYPILPATVASYSFQGARRTLCRLLQRSGHSCAQLDAVLSAAMCCVSSRKRLVADSVGYVCVQGLLRTPSSGRLACTWATAATSSSRCEPSNPCHTVTRCFYASDSAHTAALAPVL